MSKAFVLLSGGIDSATCLYLARSSFDKVEAVSYDYGQRHSRELDHAAALCHDLDVRHNIIYLAGIVPKTMLTDRSANIPDISYGEIKGISPTYVPFRNGLMLSALASFAQGRRKLENDPLQAARHGSALDDGEWGIYFGAHAEDAAEWAYPDCTPEFIGAMANAIYIGTYQQVRLFTPLQWLRKRQIIQVGEDLGVPWHNTWSCYKGEKLHCGVCPTCRARRQAFIDADVKDPTNYAR